MKRFVLSLAAAALLSGVSFAQEATLPTPDAKTIGMGGVMMTAHSGSHAIYNNPANALFSRSTLQVSSSYYGQGAFDYYAVSGACRIAPNSVTQIGWRQYLRERGNNDMALDFGYSHGINENWAVGIVARYLHLHRPDAAADALAADLCAAYQLPVDHIGTYSVLRAGAKIANLGAYLSETGYQLPIDIMAGVALDTFLTDAHEITVGADWGYYFHPANVRGFQMSLGMEYNLMQLVQFRGGYHYGERRYYYPSYWSAGIGVRILHLRLDFAYLFAEKDTLLHNTYSISFGFDF